MNRHDRVPLAEFETRALVDRDRIQIDRSTRPGACKKTNKSRSVHQLGEHLESKLFPIQNLNLVMAQL